MFPVLKLVVLFLSLLLVIQPSLIRAQSSSNTNLKLVDVPLGTYDISLDDVGRELVALGKAGVVVQQVRSEIVALLAEENSCSNWFLSAEPAARAKFRSLHFEIDSSGPAEIVKIEGPQSQVGYYHPYVASTRQDVGPGSTITLNANGAFFRASAFVRDPNHPSDRISAASYRSLSVGNFTGETPEARLLTVLHEFGHIVDLLPIDSGVPAAALISVQNTELVLHHCSSQVRAHARHLRINENPGKVFSAALTDRSAQRASPRPIASTFRASRASFYEQSTTRDGW